MGKGEEILNQAVQQGKNFAKQSAKKLARMLLTNPITYLVLGIVLIIIIIIGTMVDVNSGPVENEVGYTNSGISDFSGQKLVGIAQGLHNFIRDNDYAYSCLHNVEDEYSNSCTCDQSSHFGKYKFEDFNSVKCIDCSAYVSWVLNQYLGDEKFPSRRTSHWFAKESNWLGDWEKININDIQAGDILWKNGHVGIYIGNGQTLEAGCTRAIRADYSFGSIQSVINNYEFAIRIP